MFPVILIVAAVVDKIVLLDAPAGAPTTLEEIFPIIFKIIF
jgi:hypothetical protein